MREEILYYLKEFDYIHLIPDVTYERKLNPEHKKEPASEPTSAINKALESPMRLSPPSEPKGPDLVRGRRIQVKQNGYGWEAVYWGADATGPIVVHKTHGTWDLMHFDMTRYAEKITYGDMISEEELEEINKELGTLNL
jgi:hypothetical protein